MDKNIITGIRNSAENIEKNKKKRRTSKFKLREQPDFKGSKETLIKMQDAERLYREGKPVMSDEEWDKLVKETGYIESLDETVSPNGRLWYKMLAPLTSLNKCTSIEDLKKYRKRFPEDKKFIVSPKLDGLTFNLVYKENEDGDFERYMITTRGDGINGLALEENALKGVELYGCPEIIDRETVNRLNKLDCVIDGKIEIRGEAVIDRNDYSKVGPEQDYNDILARSIAAGIFNRKTPNNLSYISSLFPDNIEWEDMHKDYRKILYKYGIISKGKLKETSSPYDKACIRNKEIIVHNRNTNEWLAFKDSEYTGLTRKIETLHFISFSIASVNGNVDDPDILGIIPGILYVNNIKDFEGISKITNDINEIIESIDTFYGTINGERDLSKVRKKNKIRFACDGLVIKPVGSNNRTQRLDPYKKAGKIVVPRYPSDQIAIKLPTDKVKTRIKKINYTKTKLGNITCGAEIEPVKVEGGAIVSRVNLHNPSWLSLPENSWIKEGVECYLQMSMDIIPLISEIKDE